MDWLQRITTALADETGIDPAELTLPPEVRKQLLDVARTASHTSGNRINAPLLCYVLGVLSARGADLTKAIAVVEANTDAP